MKGSKEQCKLTDDLFAEDKQDNTVRQKKPKTTQTMQEISELLGIPEKKLAIRRIEGRIKKKNPQTGKEETHGTGTWKFHLFIKDKVLAEKHKNMRAKGSTLGELYLQVAFYAELITKDWEKALAKNSENALRNMEVYKQNEILKDTGQLVPIPPRPYEEEYQMWLQVKMLERELDGWD